MANTEAVYARIDKNLKEDAEDILHQLGITPSSAIQMLYSQIVMTQSFPLNLQVHYRKPASLDEMTQDEINQELEKGYTSAKAGRTYTTDEVDRMMKDEFGL